MRRVDPSKLSVEISSKDYDAFWQLLMTTKKERGNRNG